LLKNTKNHQRNHPFIQNPPTKTSQGDGDLSKIIQELGGAGQVVKIIQQKLNSN
jgi:hypothetical protein